MTFLARPKQVLFHDRAFRIIDRTHVVHTMAIDANWFVGLLIWCDDFEQDDCRTVEISYVGLEDLCAHIVASHQLSICMTFSTDLR